MDGKKKRKGWVILYCDDLGFFFSRLGIAEVCREFRGCGEVFSKMMKRAILIAFSKDTYTPGRGCIRCKIFVYPHRVRPKISHSIPNYPPQLPNLKISIRRTASTPIPSIPCPAREQYRRSHPAPTGRLKLYIATYTHREVI